MNTFIQMLILAIVASLLTACGSKPVVPLIDFITIADEGETVAVQRGGTIHLDLASINNDRRTWYVTGDIPSNLKLIKEPNYRAFKDDYLKGETVVWEFRTTEIGLGVLNFAYQGESKSDVSKRFSVTIDVNEPRTVFQYKQIKKNRDRENKKERKELEKLEKKEKKQAEKLARSADKTEPKATDSSDDKEVSKKKIPTRWR